MKYLKTYETYSDEFSDIDYDELMSLSDDGEFDVFFEDIKNYIEKQELNILKSIYEEDDFLTKKYFVKGDVGNRSQFKDKLYQKFPYVSEIDIIYDEFTTINSSVYSIYTVDITIGFLLSETQEMLIELFPQHINILSKCMLPQTKNKYKDIIEGGKMNLF